MKEGVVVSWSSPITKHWKNFGGALVSTYPLSAIWDVRDTGYSLDGMTSMRNFNGCSFDGGPLVLMRSIELSTV